MTAFAPGDEAGYTVGQAVERTDKEWSLTKGTQRRVVFFDLDGTLHQQDMFGTFMRYLLRRQPINVLLVAHELATVGHYLRPQ